MPSSEFRALAAQIGAQQPLSVWLVQFDPRWVEDDAAIELRDPIDDALLRHLIVEGANASPRTSVRRMLLYDLPDRGASRELDERQSDWAERLQRDLVYLGEDFDYEVKQYVLPSGARTRLAPDIASTAVTEPAAFARLWNDKQRTFRVEAGDKGATAPYSDQDLLYYMDLEVGDTERRQFRSARGTRRTRPRSRPMWLPRWRS